MKKVYSNVRNFKSDLKKFKPHFLIVVPRLLETIWKVRVGMGVGLEVGVGGWGRSCYGQYGRWSWGWGSRWG